MRKVYLFLSLSLISIHLHSQQMGCADFETPLFVQNGYDHAAKMQDVEFQIQSWLTSDNINNRQVVVIPVVIHVLYHTASENIPDASIYSQLNFLNRDFRRQNYDAVNTPSAFQPIAADVMIEFCLADIDTNGNYTTGITRTYTDTAVFMDDMFGNNQYYNPSTGGVSPWDPTKYLNIYVINRSYFAGTASSPASHGQQWDGIAMDYPYFYADHALSHEVGHYFALNHVFGSTFGNVSCGDDLVSDTPVQDYNYGCPTYPKYSCGNTTVSDMFMNYMDYTSSSCKNLFTVGQANRMNATLNTTRASLLNSTLCPYIGIEEQSNFNFTFYPNPVSDQLVITMAKNLGSDLLLNVYDISGKVILSQLMQVDSNDVLDVSSLSSGIYFLNISDGKNSKTKKLIKN